MRGGRKYKNEKSLIKGIAEIFEFSRHVYLCYGSDENVLIKMEASEEK